MAKPAVRKTPRIVASPLAMRLRELRLDKGWTQEYVANAIGVHQVTYCFYESGRHAVRLPRLRQLAELYELPLSDLADGYEMTGDESKIVEAADVLRQPA